MKIWLFCIFCFLFVKILLWGILSLEENPWNKTLLIVPDVHNTTFYREPPPGQFNNAAALRDICSRFAAPRDDYEQHAVVTEFSDFFDRVFLLVHFFPLVCVAFRYFTLCLVLFTLSIKRLNAEINPMNARQSNLYMCTCARTQLSRNQKLSKQNPTKPKKPNKIKHLAQPDSPTLSPPPILIVFGYRPSRNPYICTATFF